jgi:hypothetical protein
MSARSAVREGFARSLGEGELPGEESNGVRRQPGMPDQVVGELGEGARGRGEEVAKARYPSFFRRYAELEA